MNSYHKIIKKDGKKTLISNLSIKLRQLYVLFNIIIFFMKIASSFCDYNSENISSELSEVTLKVNVTKTNMFKLFSDYFFGKYSHCEIYLNDSNYDNNTNKFYINSNYSKIDITIKIFWNDSISTTNSMFENCDRILEIDLSKFDTSKVINMDNMFLNCISLTSLIISNFNT